MSIDPIVVVVLVTVPDDPTADRLARALVERRLAACVNVVPGIRSHYRWEGSVHRDDECLLIAKTRASRFEDLRRAVVDLHPYETPEVVRLPVDGGDPRYLAWVGAETADGSEGP